MPLLKNATKVADYEHNNHFVAVYFASEERYIAIHLTHRQEAFDGFLS